MRVLAGMVVWLATEIIFANDSEDEREVRAIVACSVDPVTISCEDYHQMAAVQEATFYETGHYCRQPPPPPPRPPSDAPTAVPRHSVLSSFNRRCSGRLRCTFLLHEHHPKSASWRPGVLYVRYRCILREKVTKFCSEVLTDQRGLLANPGYPHYYPGDVNCSWHLHVDQGQRIRVSLLDLDIRGVRQGSSSCSDFLRVSEGRRVLSQDCGALERPRVVTSRGSQVMVTLWAQGQPLYPHRGVLVHYTAVGCASPVPPRDGYQVYRNETHALFSCCVNFVFADTLRKDRLLTCRDGHGWSHDLPRQCIDVRILLEFANATVRRILERELVTVRPELSAVEHPTDTTFIDTILPIIILVAMIVANCIIVAVIMVYRKRENGTERPCIPSPPVEWVIRRRPVSVYTIQRQETAC